MIVNEGRSGESVKVTSERRLCLMDVMRRVRSCACVSCIKTVEGLSREECQAFQLIPRIKRDDALASLCEQAVPPQPSPLPSLVTYIHHTCKALPSVPSAPVKILPLRVAVKYFVMKYICF